MAGQQREIKRDREIDAALAEHAERSTGLTDKQRAFCLLYAKTFNATRAYYEVYGCSYKAANRNGWRLMQSPKIQQEVGRLRRLRNEYAQVSAEDVLERYRQIAFANMGDFLEWGVRSEAVPGGEEGEMREVEYVRIRDSALVDGSLVCEVKRGRDGVSVKLADRMKALEILAKITGLLPEGKAGVAEEREDVEFRVLPPEEKE